jgi:di/tripeptidase
MSQSGKTIESSAKRSMGRATAGVHASLAQPSNLEPHISDQQPPRRKKQPIANHKIMDAMEQNVRNVSAKQITGKATAGLNASLAIPNTLDSNLEPQISDQQPPRRKKQPIANHEIMDAVEQNVGNVSAQRITGKATAGLNASLASYTQHFGYQSTGSLPRTRSRFLSCQGLGIGRNASTNWIFRVWSF